MKLFKHQFDLVNQAPSKHLLAWETGTGKTLAAIELAIRTGNGNTLVICPKSLKEQWLEQIPNNVEWDVVTKEDFRKNWESFYKYNILIIDEAHYFSGMKSQMHKSLIKYIKKHDPQYIYLLTATPYLSTPFNIYCLANILGHRWSYQKFKNTFFSDVRMGNRIIPVIKKGIEPQIAKLVNTIGNTVKLQDCIDVPEQIYQTEYFTLTTAQKKAIKDIEGTETTHITKWCKIHQICGGTLKGDGYTETRTYKSEKLERLKDICREHKKVVVVCRYNAEVEMICDWLKTLDTHAYLKITGNTKDKHSGIKRANAVDIPCVVVVNAACCVGYELPTFDLMVFYSYDFSMANTIQMRGRINRINHPKKNVYLSFW